MPLPVERLLAGLLLLITFRHYQKEKRKQLNFLKKKNRNIFWWIKEHAFPFPNFLFSSRRNIIKLPNMRQLKFTKEFKKLFPPSQFTLDSQVRKIIGMTFFFLFAQTFLLLPSYNSLPPLIPLFYSRPWGAAQLTDRANFFLLPFLSALIFLLNLFFASLLYSREKILSFALLLTALVFVSSLFVTEIKIVSLFY